MPADSASGGFRNADLLPSAERTFEYEVAARFIADTLDFDRHLSGFASCLEQVTPCTTDFVHELGRHLYRRPLSESEAERLSRLFDRAKEEGDDFGQGARLVVQAMLQSPYFLYRLERSDRIDEGAGHPHVDQYELATRLSFLLWQSAPDSALLELARDGELSGKNLRSLVESLLDDPRARRGFRGFVEEWLGVYRLDTTVRDEELSPSLARAMKTETLGFFERLVFDDRHGFLQTFTRQESVLSEELAKLYGFRDLAVGQQVYDLAEVSSRRGFLTHPAVIISHTPTTVPSLVDRGLFVLRTILCEDVPPPPANAAADLESIPEDLPERERLRLHTQNPACQSCHRVFDPLGYPFQIYDGVGRLRPIDEHGNRIPTDGEMLLDGEKRAFRNIHEFAELLAKAAGVERCIVRSFLEYAHGRGLDQADAPLVDALVARFRTSGHQMLDLITDVATSPSTSHLVALEPDLQQGPRQ